MVITWKDFNDALTPSIQGQVKLRKLAGLFAGMNHMQPLLLATTNSNYLLDRFCMERCCSGEYVSRIVTSLIFMEVMATLLVACLGVYIACKYSSEWEDSTKLNNWNEKYEERYRGYISSAIQCLILVGYLQIFLAFTTGGKKGHMHWFYLSLMIQQFVCLLIGGAIGFWEVGVTLWYLMAIPMAPIIVFFYQLYIHSWIRNNGPRDTEYLVVEWQIGLALCISILATLFWAHGYVKSYIPIELEIQSLDSSVSADKDRINAGPITLQIAYSLAKTNGQSNPVTGNANSLSGIGLPKVTADVHLTAYFLTLTTITATMPGSPTDKKYDVTTTLRAGLNIVFKPKSEPAGGAGTVKVQSATKTGQPVLTLNIQPTSTSMTNVKVYSENVDKSTTENSVDISLIAEAEGTIDSSKTINSVEVSIPVNIIVKDERGEQSETIKSVSLKLPIATASPGTVEIKKLTLTANGDSGANTLAITVTAGESGPAGDEDTDPKAKFVKVSGTGYTPKKGYYSIYSVREGNGDKKDIWANIVGQCTFAACYKKKPGTGALLCLYLRGGDTLSMKYYGKGNDGQWKTISETQFIQKLPELATQSTLTLTDGTKTPQYNRVYKDAILNSPTWLPLLMHGMAVGSFGSIFPNLIPKTLVCARTSRTLSVVSIFLSPVPHIINLALAENDLLSSIGTGAPWEGGIHTVWSLYILYGLAFLFAIFNVHSPEWKLCCYIRSHGWMPFMMTLSITLIIEILIAIARAGIMMQKPASSPSKDKNHPLLWNKMFCLMSLSYLPFWLTTTPMMKSYVSSLDPFLCDKDRDHWPTARYGRMRSFGYWCKCACRGLYNSPRKLVTLDMRKALTRKDPKVYFLVTHDLGISLMTIVEGVKYLVAPVVTLH